MSSFIDSAPKHTPPGEVFKLVGFDASSAMTELAEMSFRRVGPEALQRTLEGAETLNDAIQITFKLGAVSEVTDVLKGVKDKTYHIPRGGGSDLYVR